MQIFTHHTKLTLQVECFRHASSTFPFNLREAEEAQRLSDEALPNQPVHVLRLHQDLRLHVRISPEKQLPFSIEGVVAVRLASPDEDFVDLETVQKRQNDTIDVMSLVQPQQLPSKRLHTVTPAFGFVDRRYVKLTVQLRVLLGAPFRREVDLYYPMYCKIVQPRGRLRLHRRVECLGAKTVMIKDPKPQLLTGIQYNKPPGTYLL